MRSGLGLAHIKAEGAPIHPDDTGCSWHDHMQYMKQARAYYKHHNMTDEWITFKKMWRDVEESTGEKND